MKKLFFVFAALLVMAVSVNAQEKGDMAVGAKFAIGTGDSYTNMGLGVKFQWNVSDAIRLEPAFTYFLKKDYVTHTNLDLNVHYLFNLSDSFNLYPLAGAGIYWSKLKASGVEVKGNDVCINLGAGFDYKMSESLALNVEGQFKLVDGSNRFVPSVGLTYKF